MKNLVTRADITLPSMDSGNNYTFRDVIGNKLDTAAGTSLIAIVKALTLTTTTLKGLVFYARCDAGMAGSTTTIVTDDMIGFGDSFFNTKFYIYIIKNANSVGAVPDGQIRQVSTYTSVSGTFVCVAFTANVEANDDIFIIHESLAGFVSTFGSSGISNDFDGCLMEILKAGLEKTTAGAFDPDTDSNEAISMTIAALNNISTGQVNAEVVDVVNTDDKLDKLISADDRPAATVYPVSVVVESILAFIMSKSASPDASSFNNTTDSLEALSDKHLVPTPADSGANTDMRDVIGNKTDTVAGDSLMGYAKNNLLGLATLRNNLIADVSGTDVYPANVVDDSILARIFGMGNPATVTGFSNLTDSLEAISKYIRGVTTLPNATKREAGREQTTSRVGSFTGLNNSAYVEFTATTGDVIVESLIIRLTDDMSADGNLTSIGFITSDTDTNTNTIIAATLTASCVALSQFVYTGNKLIISGGTIKINVVSTGAIATTPAVYTTYVKYRAMVDGAYLNPA